MQSRVEHVEHAERVSTLSHYRLGALMLWLYVLDGAALSMCAILCIRNGPSVLLLFGFEFAILAVSLCAAASRYGLFAVEQRLYEGQWTAKGSYVFAVDFVAEVLRFAFYVVFFTIVFTYYGVPLHIVRELWVSYVSLRRRLAAYKRYRALTANMDERFPSATDEELDACGRICIICRDGMDEGKKLPCGHIFHFGCLRLWLQQQQSCPTCRQDIPVEAPAPAPQPQAPVEQPQPGAGWAAPRQPEAAQPGAGAVQQPAAAQPQPAQRLEDVLAAALRRLEHNLAAEEPQAPSGGARVWTARAGGASVRATRDAAAPPLRTVPAGEHVLALPDDGEYLRVGDGFILMSELDLLLDETATASAAAETGAASPPRSPAPVERAEVARLRAERFAQPQQPDVAAALDALREQLAAVQRDVAWLRAREEARME